MHTIYGPYKSKEILEIGKQYEAHGCCVKGNWLKAVGELNQKIQVSLAVGRKLINTGIN